MLTEGRQRLSWRRLFWQGVPAAWGSNRESPATVESLTEGTTRRLVPAERNVRRPCRSATGTRGPSRPGIAARSHEMLYTSARQPYIQSVVRRACQWSVSDVARLSISVRYFALYRLFFNGLFRAWTICADEDKATPVCVIIKPWSQFYNTTGATASYGLSPSCNDEPAMLAEVS